MINIHNFHSASVKDSSLQTETPLTNIITMQASSYKLAAELLVISPQENALLT